MQENFCGLSSNLTVAPTGTVGSIVSGIGVGSSQASLASKNAIQETNLSERDSLLKGLDILSKAEDAHEENPLGMDLFPEAIRDMLALTRNSAASSVNKLLIAPATVSSHISQLPIDIAAVFEGLSRSIKNYHELLQTQQASTLNVDKELQEKKSGFSANCQALCDHFSGIFDELNEHIDGRFKHPGSANKSHAFIAQSIGSVSALGSLGTAGLISLMVDMIGSSLREMTGSVEFSKQESLHPKEKNVYKALSNCSKSISESKNSEETFQALHELERALSDFDPASEMRENHSVSGPSLSVLTRLITATPFLTTLFAVNASSLGLMEATEALRKEKALSSQNSRNTAADASFIIDSSGPDHHSQNVTAFCEQFDEALKHIDQQLEAKPNHESVASSAKSTVGSTGALVIAASLIPGFTGLVSREFSGSIDFTRNDKGSREESTAVLRSRSEMTGDDLDKLMSRVCALEERVVRCNELGVSAPVVLGVSEAITSGSVIASLNIVAGMYSALKECRTMSHSPSQATQLEDAEKAKAQQYVQSVIDSNKKTGGVTGTGVVSDNLSLHQHLQSVMDKVVLMHRSYMNSLNFGANRHDLNSAGKSTIGSSQGNSTGFLMGALGVIGLTALESGIGLEALFGSFRYSTQTRRASDGVDRIESDNGSRTNLSFLSNATRLLEEHFKSSSVTQTSIRTTHLAFEGLSSRSLTVALCHSGALTEILRRIVNEELDQLKHVDGQLDSALVSDALMPKLYNSILKVLDDAEIDHNPIPNLNQDMASALGCASNASLATALASHSVFISPILKSIVAAKKASNIAEGQKNEALTAHSEISRIISTASNVMQGFTLNFIDEVNEFDNPIKNSSPVHSSNSLNDTAMIASCAISLLCEELFEICVSRSFTLLDKDKVAQTAKQSSDQTKKESGLSLDGVKEDSGLGQDYSVSHVISAMRLTLSHLGVSLGELASKLDASSDLLKNDLEMHSSQKTLMKSLVSSFGEFSQIMLAISAGLSNFPVSTAGSTDSLRRGIHSIDHSLILEPVHSSADSSKEFDSESCLLTGMSTDCVSSIMTAATKLLLQASVLGLDTTLSVAKIMEILSIHPRPIEALTLETQALSQPNGLSNNISKQTQNLAVVSTLGLASVSIATRTDQSQSTDKSLQVLQLAIDAHIDQIALLEDTEENVIGLKAFYELLIRLLHGGDEHANYKDIVLRFHRGGIALSNYHSAHGGFKNSERERNTNRLISEYGFNKCDDAASLLKLFIDKAILDERRVLDRKDKGIFDEQKDSPALLTQLKQELIGHHMSPKVEKRWNYIINKVIDDLKNENSRMSLLHPGKSRSNQKKWEDRRNELLHNWVAPLPPKEKEELSENTQSPSI